MRAFFCNSNLKAIIPNSVKKIESEAFALCPGATIYCEFAKQPQEWSATWHEPMGSVYWYANDGNIIKENSWYYDGKGNIIEGLDWRGLFSPTILERGQNISFENILNINITNNGLKAIIQGSEEYIVEIDAGLTKITCTCPFFKKHDIKRGMFSANCKHLACVFFYLETHWNDQLTKFFKDFNTSQIAKR